MILDGIVNILTFTHNGIAAKVSAGMHVGSEGAQVRRDERLTFLMLKERDLLGDRTYIEVDKEGHLFPRFEATFLTTWDRKHRIKDVGCKALMHY